MKANKKRTLIAVALATMLSTTVSHAASDAPGATPPPPSIGAAVTGALSLRDGGVGINYAYSEGDQSDGTFLPGQTYNVRAESTFNIGALTPELRVYASTSDIRAEPDAYISASAYAFQTYQNTSSFSQTYTLNLSVHGTISNLAGNTNSYLATEVNIFGGTDIVSNYADCNGSPANRMLGFNSYVCGPELESAFAPRFSGIDIIGDGEQTLFDTVSFTIGGLDTFTIYGELEAITTAGTVDGFNTLSMNFDDISNLRALGEMPSPVPVPAAVWLFGSGLLGLIGFARRKNRV